MTYHYVLGTDNPWLAFFNSPTFQTINAILILLISILLIVLIIKLILFWREDGVQITTGQVSLVLAIISGLLKLIPSLLLQFSMYCANIVSDFGISIGKN